MISNAAMTTENQGMHETELLWENQSWDFPNFGNSSESKEKLFIELPNQEKENGEKPLMNKKRSRENADESGKKVINAKEKVEKSRDPEARRLAERERRRRTRNMYDDLHALLPQLSYKADKAAIIDEAADYIKSLEQTLAKLEIQKKERLQSASASASKEKVIGDHESVENFFNGTTGDPNPSSSAMMPAVVPQQQPLSFQTWSSPNVVISISGMEAHFSIFTAKKRGLLADIALVFENHKIDVLYATIAGDSYGDRFMILTQLANRSPNELILENIPVEEIFKQAAKDIVECISKM